MPITVQTMNLVRYPPELLPDAQLISWGAAGTLRPLELRRLPWLVNLDRVATARNANIFLQLMADERLGLERATDAKALQADGDPAGMWASSAVEIRLRSTAVVANFPIWYSLWVSAPTIALKLLLGLTLTPGEQQLADRYELAKKLQEGTLPLPFSTIIEREYRAHVRYADTVLFSGATTVAGVTVADLRPGRAGEFLVLRGIRAEDPGGGNELLELRIQRDDDVDYLALRARALGGIDAFVPCFVPATSQLTFTAAGVVVGLWRVGLEVWHVKLTETHAARFGLPASQEAIDKVRAGVA